MEKETIKFSIVMPVFNSSGTLNKSIGSIKLQSYTNWELIIVDDGSNDNSYEMIKSFASSDSRIRFFQQENRGPGAARNKGMYYCIGDYITFLDSDDYWDSDYLMYLYIKAKESGADCIFTDIIYESNNGQGITYSSSYRYRSCSKFEIICKQMTGLISWGMNKAFRREILATIGYGFTDLSVGEEAIFSFDVLNNSNRIEFVKKPIYHYVQNPNGQHKKGELDPWGPVVRDMKAHICNIGQYSLYERNINSFALRALCISLYRISCDYNLYNALKKMKQKNDEYRLLYSFTELNMGSLDQKSIIIYFLIRMKLYFFIYFISKIRNKRKNQKKW